MKTQNITKIFQTKLIESEFENQPRAPKDEIVAPYQHLIDELHEIKKKRMSYNFQGDQLERKLFYLKKNYYDDMHIIDENYNGYDGEVFPWKSPAAHTRNNYASWDIQTLYLNLTEPAIFEVAIRKHLPGNAKQIRNIDNIVQRLQRLDQMCEALDKRKLEIKKELNTFCVPSQDINSL